MAGLRVSIVGGGIGGLAAAVALQHRGIQAHVYEQAPALGEVGAGLMIQANSLRQMDRLGIADRVADAGEQMTEFRYTLADGTILSQEPFSTGPENMFYCLHRADLLEAFAAVLPDDVLHTGHQCVGFEQNPDHAVVTFDNGLRVESDVVIAADGIRSILQPHVGERSGPVFSGIMAYRGIVEASKVPDWPAQTIRFWSGGEGRYLLCYRVRAGELLNFVGIMPCDDEMRTSWSAPGDPATLAAAYAGWDPLAEDIVSKVETTFRAGLYDRDPLSRWSRGRLTLLGDAAHASLPHMGQGVNQAIEDGIGLATLLDGINAEDVPRALANYEELRRDRTARVQRTSRANAADAKNATSFVVGHRWLYDYDVETEAAALRLAR
jgi:salicylate hydroxylase